MPWQINMDSTEQPELYESYFYTSLYVFWKQPDASAVEIAALREIDPDLRDKTLAEATALVNDEFWVVGSFRTDSEADAMEARLRSAGFYVKRVRR